MIPALIFLVVVGYALTIWALVDAATRPDSTWTAAGQSKILWIVLLLVLAIFTPFGSVIAIVYLASIRPKLMARQAGRQPGTDKWVRPGSTCQRCGSHTVNGKDVYCPSCGSPFLRQVSFPDR